MGKLTDHWNNKVTKNHKHFINNMPESKAKDHLNRFRKHVIEQINMGDIKFALDWGCGGGLLAKELLNYCHVITADISEESLDEAHKHIRKPHLEILLTDDPSELKIEPLPKIDLILCYSVIQHFPSVEHWDKVVEKWLEIQPKHIAAQIKLGAKTTEHEQYYVGRNYLNGLFLNRNNIEKAFPNYFITYWADARQIANRQKIAFFILTKND